MENQKAKRMKIVRHAIMIVVLSIMFVAFIFPFVMVIINVFRIIFSNIDKRLNNFINYKCLKHMS